MDPALTTVGSVWGLTESLSLTIMTLGVTLWLPLATMSKLISLSLTFLVCKMGMRISASPGDSKAEMRE